MSTVASFVAAGSLLTSIATRRCTALFSPPTKGKNKAGKKLKKGDGDDDDGPSVGAPILAEATVVHGTAVSAVVKLPVLAAGVVVEPPRPI